MKKRLLSAALALAMVLTLLPVSAFAAPSTTTDSSAEGKTLTRATADIKDGSTLLVSKDQWYWQEGSGDTRVYHIVNSGVVAGNKWYSSINPLYGSSWTLLGDTEFNLSDPNWSSLTIDLNGNHSLSLAHTNVGGKATSLSITNSLDASGNKQGSVTGAITAGTQADGGGRNFNVTMTNINYGAGITIYHKGNSKVTLNNSNASGICVEGHPDKTGGSTSDGKVELTNGATCGEIYINQTTGANDTLKISGSNTTVTGNITVMGKSSTISVSDGARVTGDVSLTGDSSHLNVNSATVSAKTKGHTVSGEGSGITLTRGTIVGGTAISGNKNSLTMDGGTFEGSTVTITGHSTTVKMTDRSKISTPGQLKLIGSTDKDHAKLKSTVSIDNSTIEGGFEDTYTSFADVVTEPTVVTMTNGAHIDDTATFNNCTVTLTDSSLGTTLMKQNKLTVNSTKTNGGSVGVLTLGSTGDGTVALQVTGTATSSVNMGEIKMDGANGKTLNVDLAGPSNIYDKISLAADYVAGTVVGNRGFVEGTVKNMVSNRNWMNKDIEFVMQKDGVRTYVTAKDYQLMADRYKQGYAITTVNGDKDGTKVAVIFSVEGQELLKVTALPNAVITMPSRLTYDTPEWYRGGDQSKHYPAGSTYTVLGTEEEDSKKQVTFTARASVLNLTSLEQVDVISDSNIFASLTKASKGGTITLSGGIDASDIHAGAQNMIMKLTANDEKDYFVSMSYYNGKVTLNDMMKWDDTTKKYVIDDASPLKVNRNTNTITLPNDAVYTVPSTVKELADIELAGLGTGANASHVVVNNITVPGYGVEGKAQLIQAIEKRTTKDKQFTNSSTVDFSDSPAVKQAANAEANKLTQSQVDKYLSDGQTMAWRAADETNRKNKTPTEAERLATGYDTVQLFTYLSMDISLYDHRVVPGTMTFTLTPYYRIQVVDKDTLAKDPMIVKTGAALGTLATNMGEVDVTIGTEFKNVAATKSYVHHDGKYNYAATTTVPAAPPAGTSTADVAFTILNGPKGTFVLDEFGPMISRHEPVADFKNNVSSVTDPAESSWKPAAVAYYDTLQAAVDQTKNKERLKVSSDYKGSTSITPTGTARTIYIDTEGSSEISVTDKAVATISQPSGNSKRFVVQLTKNLDVKPEETGIPITVNGATGGTASVSKSRANEGDTITITLSPSSGYQSSGVTVRSTDGTTTTNISVSGSGNRFTFTVPKGSKGVTVTPAFVRVNTGVLITVSGGTYGTATTSAGSNRVAVGSTVSVTVEPRSGYRTMGLYVTADTGSTATPYRTGVNTFTFTVPNATSSVVVTPRFDVNNGTVFEDVWSTDYYSSPVSWAVRQGVTDGTDTYHFSPGQSCNRVQMVTFLWRAAGRPSTAGMANPFYDVSPSMGNDFYNAILWANAKGITNGDGSTVKFSPNGYCLREQIVTFMYRNATGTRA